MRAMNKKHEVQIGIIGAGMIGVDHIRGFRVIPRCSVIAVADPNEEHLIKATSDFSISYSFSDYKDLLKLEELDGVIICAPPFVHEEIAVNALAAGKHVLCEKPLAISSASAARIAKRAKKSGKILASCSGRYRFSPTITKAKELIDSGELGEIYHISLSGISRRNRPGIDFHASAKWCLDKSKAGGGAMLDWGIYDINILHWLIEGLTVKSVDGFCYRGVGNVDAGDTIFDVEEHGAALLRCKNNLTVNWERAWAAHMNSSARIRIYGSQAGVAFDPLAWTQDIFFQIYEDRSGKPVTIAPATTFERWSVILSIAQDFVSAIAKNRPPISPGEEEVQYLKVIEAVYKSNQKGVSIKI